MSDPSSEQTQATPADLPSVAGAEPTPLADTIARLYGEPLTEIPKDLYIPPDALEVILETFEGPLDLLLYLIRRQNFNILDIPMAEVTRQYLSYVEEIRSRNLELAADYLLMAAMLIEIKSRMLLPVRPKEGEDEVDDPRAELVRRLLEYEQMKIAARQIDTFPQLGRDVLAAQVYVDQTMERHSSPGKAHRPPPHQPRAPLGARAHVPHLEVFAGSALRRIHRALHGRAGPRRWGAHRGGAFSRPA